MPERMSECMSDRMPDFFCQNTSEYLSDGISLGGDHLKKVMCSSDSMDW